MQYQKRWIRLSRELLQKVQFGSCFKPIFVRRTFVGRILCRNLYWKFRSFVLLVQRAARPVCHSPIRNPSVTVNEVFPFRLTFHRSRAFGREKLLVNHPVSFVAFNKGLEESTWFVCVTRFFRKICIIMVSEGRYKAKILQRHNTYFVRVYKLFEGEEVTRVLH